MKEKEDKQMDDLTRKVIKMASLESPSFDFTAQILAQVIASKQSETTVFKPLISKTAWLVIFGSLTALVIYGIGVEPQVPDQFGILNFSTLLNDKVITMFSRFTFSKTLLYALFSLSTMVFIQVYVFKRYLDKRFEG
ncbi:hypothetical protein D3C85_862900 [compost metagenome]